MKKINLLFSLFAIGILLIACDDYSMVKEEISASTKVLNSKSGVNSFKVVDGVLHFDSLEAASLLVSSLEKMSTQQLFEWEEMNGFYSLYHAISDAENDILSDSLVSQEKLEKYKKLVYTEEDGSLKPIIFARFYQLVCNQNGYFYIGEYRHKVNSSEVVVIGGKNRSIEKRSYVATQKSFTKSSDPWFSLGNSTYTGNKRRVTVEVAYYRNIGKNSNGKWEGQQMLQVESRSGKKVLGSYKNYKTLHVHDVLAYWVDSIAYRCPDGTYAKYRVRYEGLGAGGSVGEEKSCVIPHPLTPSNMWIPEEYIPTNKSDVRFVQVRAKTRGTGDSGAVLIYGAAPFPEGFPFSIPNTGATTVLRNLVMENIK